MLGGVLLIAYGMWQDASRMVPEHPPAKVPLALHAPLTPGNRPYHLILRTKAGDGSEGHLHLYVTRTELAEPNLSLQTPEPCPTPATPSADTRCLVAILNGEAYR